jgi:hypothetical protein
MDHVLKEDTEVWLVDAELGLHGLGGQAYLAAARTRATACPLRSYQSLNGVGGFLVCGTYEVSHGLARAPFFGGRDKTLCSAGNKLLIHALRVRS